MLADLLTALIRANLAAAIAVLVAMAIRWPVRRAFGAHAAYALWIVPALAALASLAPQAAAPTLADPVVLQASHVTVSQVVAIDYRGGGCALRIATDRLEQAGVNFSLFAGNYGSGLCAMPLGAEQNPDYSLTVENTIFRDNGVVDLLTRHSTAIRLRNNMLTTQDSIPASSIAPV